MSRRPSRARRLLRLGPRLLGVLVAVLLVAPLIDAVLPLPGLVAPPALMTRHRGELDAGFLHDEFPPRSELVELAVGEGHVLRGVFVPSDEGAPVVLHLLGSGGSLLDARLRRPVFEDLAERGFASLTVDWNGVGASSGPGDVRLLRRDVHAVWDAAVARAGAPARVVVRATSLGGLAAAMLLQDGARPAALLLVAPVRAETVTSHWTRFFFGGVADWLAAPWLRPLAEVDLLAELAATDVPVLALSTSTDVLLPSDERRLLAEVLAASGGRLALDPEYHSDIRGLRIFGLMGRRMTRAESSHFVQAVQARALFVDELAMLDAVLPELPLRRRLTAWRARRPPDAPALPELFEPAVARLLLHGGERFDAGLEAALTTPDPGSALRLLRLLVDGHPDWLRHADHEQLRATLDLSDPAGPLDPRQLRDAHAFFFWHDTQRQPTSGWDVGQLLSGFEHVAIGARFPEGWPPERDPPAMDGGDRVQLHGISQAAWMLGLIATGDVADARRQAVRSVLKVLGVPERLAAGRDEDRWLDVFVDGCWMLVDLDRHLPQLAPERVVGTADWEQAMFARRQGRERGGEPEEIEYPPAGARPPRLGTAGPR